MMGAFNRPIGAAADVKEMEYVSVLMQSQLPDLRKNCTVSATDISLFLHSRYGLNVPHKDCLDIVQALGGEGAALIPQDMSSSKGSTQVFVKKALVPLFKRSSSENISTRLPEDAASSAKNSNLELPQSVEDSGNKSKKKSSEKNATLPEQYLDIVQLMSILLIPSLVQAASSNDNPIDGVTNEEDDGGVSNTGILRPRSDHIDGSTRPLPPQKNNQQWQTQLSPRIFRDVLRFIIVRLSDWDGEAAKLDINASNLELVLTESRMKRILSLIGEDDQIAADLGLIRAMMERCAETNDRGLFVLNASSFARALTSDVDLWRAEWVDRKSTFYFDVFGAAVGEVDDRFKEESHSQNHHHRIGHNSHSRNLSVKISQKTEVHLSTVDYSDFNVKHRFTRVEKDLLPHYPNLGMDKNKRETSDGKQRETKERAHTLTKSNITGFVDIATDNVDVTEQQKENGKPKEDEECNGIPLSEKWNFSQSNITAFIDFIVDAQWSRLYLTCAWAFFVAESVVYGVLFSSRTAAIRCETADFGCTLANTVAAWLTTAIALCLAGFVIFIPISLANRPFRRTMKLALFSLFAVSCFTIPPFLGMLYWMRGIPHSSEYTQPEKVASTIKFKVELFVVFASGLGLLFCILLLILATVIYLYTGEKSQFVTFWVSTHDVIASYCGKQAGTHKLNNLIANAHKLHFVKASGEKDLRETEKIVMLNYEVFGESEENCGGLRWALRGARTGELFKKEGFWLHSRLFIAQIVQVFFSAWAILIMFNTTYQAAHSADEKRNEIFHDNIKYPEWIYDFFPEGWMINASFYPAASFATLVMVFLLMFPFPSTASTVMKLRCGVIPSLRDPHFMKYRVAADLVSLNLGNSIFSIVGSGGFFFLLIGIILFLSIWPYSQDKIVILYAWILGVFLTMLLKTILTQIFRMRHFSAFFRKNQTAANIIGLLLECWHIGVAPGFLISRIAQFLLASALWIGRLDVPFLSDDVNLFGFQFDSAPVSYRKDVLAHEAHRHPFIERLGALYMMRLRHGELFGLRAGSCWRILFVLFLMPWLRKHRVTNLKRLEDRRQTGEDKHGGIRHSMPEINYLGAITETVMADYVPKNDPTVQLPHPNAILEK